MTAHGGLVLFREHTARLRSLLAFQIVGGAALFHVAPLFPANKYILLGVANGLTSSLVFTALLLPALLALAHVLCWRWYRARVPSPSPSERWLFAGFAQWRPTAPRVTKGRGMVAVSEKRIVFVDNASPRATSIELAEVVTARLETKRAWHLGLEHEVCIVRANAPEVRISLIGAATLQRLVVRQ